MSVNFAGSGLVPHSEKYRSLEDYLIPKTDWNEHHDEYLQRAQLSEHADFKATLASLAKETENRYKETNDRFTALGSSGTANRLKTKNQIRFNYKCNK